MDQTYRDRSERDQGSYQEMKYVLVDIDHTLSAAHWRDLLIPMNEEQKTLGFWDEYHSKSEWDELLPDVADVILSSGCKLVSYSHNCASREMA